MLFPTHLTPAQIHDAIKGGKLLQGSFQASRENFLEGQVNVEGYEKPVCENITNLLLKIFFFFYNFFLLRDFIYYFYFYLSKQKYGLNVVINK